MSYFGGLGLNVLDMLIPSHVVLYDDDDDEMSVFCDLVQVSAKQFDV